LKSTVSRALRGFGAAGADASALDDSKVHLAPSRCTLAGDVYTCPSLRPPPPGGDFHFGFLLERQPGASGAAGSLTVSVGSTTTDPDIGNNSQTVAVNIGSSGVDLWIVAFDVYGSPTAAAPRGRCRPAAHPWSRAS
jgi:hypothetical protein